MGSAFTYCELHESSKESVTMPSVNCPGCGAIFTVTVAFFDTFPPAPVQASVYVAVAPGVTACVPEVPLVPLHAPEAVHEVAFVELQVSVRSEEHTSELQSHVNLVC